MSINVDNFNKPGNEREEEIKQALATLERIIELSITYPEIAMALDESTNRREELRKIRQENADRANRTIEEVEKMAEENETEYKAEKAFAALVYFLGATGKCVTRGAGSFIRNRQMNEIVYKPGEFELGFLDGYSIALPSDTTLGFGEKFFRFINFRTKLYFKKEWGPTMDPKLVKIIKIFADLVEKRPRIEVLNKFTGDCQIDSILKAIQVKYNYVGLYHKVVSAVLSFEDGNSIDIPQNVEFTSNIINQNLYELHVFGQSTDLKFEIEIPS